MIVKKHKSQDGKVIVAICDSNLIGKKYCEDEKQLDLTSDFYKGKEIDPEKCDNIIKEANILNIVGEKSIRHCIKKGLLSEKNVMRIAGIPFAQPYLKGD